MRQVEFKYAGIQFMVELDVNEQDKVLEQVVRVNTWNNEKRKYEPILADLEAFEHDMQDQINEALDEMYLNERLAHEDMMFEAHRESEYERLHNQ